jgi:transposase
LKEAGLDRSPSNLPINGHTSLLADVLEGPGRRRRWTGEEKARIVMESLAPAAVASEVARRYGIHPSQLYAWRRELRGEETAAGIAFAPVVSEAMAPPGGHGPGGDGIEIAYAGAVIRVGGDADPALLSRVLRTLKRLA